MTNPFARVQAQLRLSNTDMAASLAVPYNTWCQTTAGSIPAPASVLTAFAELGFDAEEFRREYTAWRSWKRQQATSPALEVACA